MPKLAWEYKIEKINYDALLEAEDCDNGKLLQELLVGLTELDTVHMKVKKTLKVSLKFRS